MLLRGLIVKQPFAAKIVRGEMPVIFLPVRAKGKFVKDLIKKSKKIVILSALRAKESVNEDNYPLGKAVGTVKVRDVITMTKEKVLSGEVAGIEREYVQTYPWESSKLDGVISIWFLENPEEWSPPISYRRMPGAQRWIKNVRLRRIELTLSKVE